MLDFIKALPSLGFPALLLLSLPIALAVLVCVVPYYQQTHPDPNSLSYDQLEKKTENILKHPTCQDIQDLHVSHIKALNWYEDPLWGMDNHDQARNLWNAMNCGTHWGFFDP